MKPIHLLLSVVVSSIVTAVGILAYHHLRSSEAPESIVEAPGVDPLRLEERVRHLEGTEPTLLGASDPQLARRVAKLEELLSDGSARLREPASVVEDESVTAPEPATIAEDAQPLDEEEVARVKRLMEAAERERREERGRRMLDGLLARLELDLTQEQMEQTIEVLAAYGGRMRSAFHSAMSSGQGRDAAELAVQEVRDEIISEMQKFLPAADAEAIVGGFRRGTGFGPGGSGGR